MGLIYNIQKFSLHDGPGVRTTVFLKGCPLQCLWCHNPESQSFEREWLYYAEKCAKCFECIKVCKNQAIRQLGDGLTTDLNLCNHCGNCLTVCNMQARKIVGESISCSELFKRISADLPFFEESGGGVTFSGGEPLCQPGFLLSCLQACHEQDIHTTVDTCGYASSENLEKIVNYTDLFLFDLKVLDDQVHQELTGVSNQLILTNLHLLIQRQKRIFLRMPIIPGINDQVKNWHHLPNAITPKTIEQINLLPYHTIGSDKYRSLGKANPFTIKQADNFENVEKLQNYWQNLGYKTIIGG